MCIRDSTDVFQLHNFLVTVCNWVTRTFPGVKADFISFCTHLITGAKRRTFSKSNFTPGVDSLWLLLLRHQYNYKSHSALGLGRVQTVCRFQNQISNWVSWYNTMSSRPGFGCRLRGTDIIPTTLYFARACDSFEVSRVGRKWRKRMPVSNVQFLSVKKNINTPATQIISWLCNNPIIC